MTRGPWGMKLTGIGAALPEKVLTNDDLTAWMDTTDEWIKERTGIGERRIGGSTSGLATQAAQRALSDAGLEPAQVCAGAEVVAEAEGQVTAAQIVEVAVEPKLVGFVEGVGVTVRGRVGGHDLGLHRDRNAV